MTVVDITGRCSADGHYVFLNHRSSEVKTDAYLTSLTGSSSGAMCLQFYHYMQGRDTWTGYLKVYVKNPSVNIIDISPVWMESGPKGDRWIMSRIPLIFGGQYHVPAVPFPISSSNIGIQQSCNVSKLLNMILMANIRFHIASTLYIIVVNSQVVFVGNEGKEGDNSIIALDDVAMLQSQCPVAATCSFEDGLCDWQNELGYDGLDWVMNQGATPTQDTGPKYDHTLQTALGHYMYIEADDGSPNDYALLTSPSIAAGQYCFEFYYYMYGADIGGLAVQSVVNGVERTKFQAFGNQGQEWKLVRVLCHVYKFMHGKVTLKEEEEFTVQLRGVLGKGPLSDMAIDDTWTTNKACPVDPGQFLCADGTGISYDKVCDFIADCPGKNDEDLCGDCNFELGSCGWTFLNTNDNIWKRGGNMTEDAGVDFVYDHTLGTDAGYFVYTSEQPSDVQGPAVMVTNPLHNSHLQCAMEFWFRENSVIESGRHVHLTVNVNKDGQTSPVFFLVDSKNRDWMFASARLMDWQGEFTVQIEGQNDNGPADLTLDDIIFTGCALPVSSDECLPYQMKCAWTGLCIQPDLLCDNTNDCGDLSDEQNCGSYPNICDFEENQLCLWIQEPENDDIDWQYGSGLTPVGSRTFLTGPPVDHTTRLSVGHYMYITPSQPKRRKKKDMKTGALATQPSFDC
nr:MAM and LDL-receptor class A domain-containing protein 1-like [Penaeus vannamei]